MDVTWQRCSSFLRDEMPPQQFNTWIRPLRAQESADELQLIAPNRFVKDWVHDKYIERIRQIVREVSGGRIAHVQLDAAGREATDKKPPERLLAPSPVLRGSELDAAALFH